MTESINSTGYPLAFKVRSRASPPIDGSDTIQVDARLLHHHQKDAIVTEGVSGSQWRLPSDEGAHLKGTDLAPFPLGFFNAGLQADLMQRIGELATERRVSVEIVELDVSNHYWFTGSFALGTGSGHAEPSRIHIHLTSGASPQVIQDLVHAALARSPAVALLREVVSSSFALWVNGRKRGLAPLRESERTGVTDPFLLYARPPVPLDPQARRDLIERTDRAQGGSAQAAAAATDGRFMINVIGRGRRDPAAQQAGIESWLQLPAATHFAYRSDVASTDSAPSGLALLSAGIAFCFMTQLSRYVEHQKLAVSGIRLVQFLRNEIVDGVACAHGVDTHLFLNGLAADDVQANLVRVAVNTCYLHASLSAALPPVVTTTLNGQELAKI